MASHPPKFDPEDIDRSHILHQFFSLRKEFLQQLSHSSAHDLKQFLSDPEKFKSFTEHAHFNPRPKIQENVEDDIENTIVALDHWLQGKVGAEVPSDHIETLYYWITGHTP